MSLQTRSRVVTVVVNPRSGRGRANRVIPAVTREISQAMPDAEVRVIRTRDYRDARERTRAVAAAAPVPLPGQQPDVLVMVGGDGMASLGLNACAGSHVQLGVVPAGTGDDFARGVGVPRDPLAAARAIASGRSRRIDLTLARGLIADGSDRRHVGSVVSSGYDAKVNHRVNHARLNLGSASYASAVLTEIAELKPLDYRLDIDGERLEVPAVLVAIGNAGYVGGGIHLCPRADPADGLLDLTIIGPVGRWTLIRLFPLLFRGKFVDHPAISYARAREVVLDGEGLVPMADGEELGSVPLHLSCVPRALEVLVGDGEFDD